MKLPQLSLRDLFWLLLVVAMGCAWWLDHQIMRSFVRVYASQTDRYLADSVQNFQMGVLNSDLHQFAA